MFAQRASRETEVASLDRCRGRPTAARSNAAAARYGPNGIGRRGRAAAEHDHRDADDRADHSRQQDHERQHLPAEPGADRGEQLEVAVAHAFLAGDQLEELDRRSRGAGSRRRRRSRSAARPRTAAARRRAQADEQPGPQQRQRHESGSSWWSRSIRVSASKVHVKPSAATVCQVEPKCTRRPRARGRSRSFDDRIARRDIGAPQPAQRAAQPQEAQDRDVVLRRDRRPQPGQRRGRPRRGRSGCRRACGGGCRSRSSSAPARATAAPS